MDMHRTALSVLELPTTSPFQVISKALFINHL
jgi:hypothetical protein